MAETCTYLVTFTPTEPYFFGGEKTFKFPGDKNIQFKNQYFIKSEAMPMQTTIFGSLRYIIMPYKHSDYKYTKEEWEANNSAIGNTPFSLEATEQLTFGKIKKISPVFIWADKEIYIKKYNEDGTEKSEILCNGNTFIIPTPFNHIHGEKKYNHFGDEETIPLKKYKPFTLCKIEGSSSLNNSCYQYASDYDPKIGLTNSYMKVSDKAEKMAGDAEIICFDDIFSPVTRVGINRDNIKEGFFKKQYYSLRNGLSFAVYLELEGKIEENHIVENHIVYMGQDKSPFVVKFTKKENVLEERVRKCLGKGIIYCVGDMYIDSSVYNNCVFSATKTKNYRSFASDYKDTNGEKKLHIHKEDIMYKFISAGSVFIPPKEKFKEVVDLINDYNKNANCIGLNSICYVEESGE